jgi:hypothetical protein
VSDLCLERQLTQVEDGQRAILKKQVLILALLEDNDTPYRLCGPWLGWNYREEH